jgi:hypothetical protein
MVGVEVKAPSPYLGSMQQKISPEQSIDLDTDRIVQYAAKESKPKQGAAHAASAPLTSVRVL